MKHLQNVIVETAEEKKNAELQAKAKASEISSMETKVSPIHHEDGGPGFTAAIDGFFCRPESQIREVAQQAEQEMQKSRDAWGKLEAEVGETRLLTHVNCFCERR